MIAFYFEPALGKITIHGFQKLNGPGQKMHTIWFAYPPRAMCISHFNNIRKLTKYNKGSKDLLEEQETTNHQLDAFEDTCQNNNPTFHANTGNINYGLISKEQLNLDILSAQMLILYSEL